MVGFAIAPGAGFQHVLPVKRIPAEPDVIDPYNIEAIKRLPRVKLEYEWKPGIKSGVSMPGWMAAKYIRDGKWKGKYKIVKIEPGSFSIPSPRLQPKSVPKPESVMSNVRQQGKPWIGHRVLPPKPVAQPKSPVSNPEPKEVTITSIPQLKPKPEPTTPVPKPVQPKPTPKPSSLLEQVKANPRKLLSLKYVEVKYKDGTGFTTLRAGGGVIYALIANHRINVNNIIDVHEAEPPKPIQRFKPPELPKPKPKPEANPVQEKIEKDTGVKTVPQPKPPEPKPQEVKKPDPPKPKPQSIIPKYEPKPTSTPAPKPQTVKVAITSADVEKAVSTVQSLDKDTLIKLAVVGFIVLMFLKR